MVTPHELVQPSSLPKPRGYTDGVLAVPGRMLFVAGQIGWGTDGELVAEDFVGQFDKALENIVTVVREAGGAPEHVCRLTLFVKDKRAYVSEIKAVGAAYRRHFGKHFPAMALLQVADLLIEGSLLEIEATAVIPEGGGSK